MCLRWVLFFLIFLLGEITFQPEWTLHTSGLSPQLRWSNLLRLRLICNDRFLAREYRLQVFVWRLEPG